jgi:hypothetical protein
MTKVSAENTKKQIKVANTPRSEIFLKLAKKLPLCMLKPEPKTIGGKQT